MTRLKAPLRPVGASRPWPAPCAPDAWAFIGASAAVPSERGTWWGPWRFRNVCGNRGVRPTRSWTTRPTPVVDYVDSPTLRLNRFGLARAFW